MPPKTERERQAWLDRQIASRKRREAQVRAYIRFYEARGNKAEADHWRHIRAIAKGEIAAWKRAKKRKSRLPR